MKRHVDDVLFLVGVLLIGYGCWMAWPPLALIFAGVVCLAAGFVVMAVPHRARSAPAGPEEES
jgi:hypothetical protein